VMQQRRSVHEFDAGGELHMTLARIAEHLRRSERHHRAKPLAARGDEMSGKLRDQFHIRPRLRQNELVDAGHVAPGKLDQAFDRAPVALAVFEVHYDTHQELPFLPRPPGATVWLRPTVPQAAN